jgi:hypothetical protein
VNIRCLATLSYICLSCIQVFGVEPVHVALEEQVADVSAREIGFARLTAPDCSDCNGQVSCDELNECNDICSSCGDCCGGDHAWNLNDIVQSLELGPSGWLEVGGSYRARYHREVNMRPGTTRGLSGVDDSFWLHQTRLWFDGQLTSNLNFRVGVIDAASAGENFPSRAREVNRHDLFQAHVNAVLHDGAGKLTARIGRQEVRYGSARLMMAPRWANRGRTHDGVRFIWESENWEVNPFWIRPVFRDRAHFRKFDNPNPNQQLYGIYSTYKGMEQDKLDLYWLAFDLRTAAGGARYDTLGSRYYGGCNAWVYEFEGGVQLGENPDNSTHTAGFCTLGIGRQFEALIGEPELWVFYDWASGDNTVGNGFHSYVQRAHYYLGQMDLFGRRNLEDLNIRLTTKPADKLTFVAWCHFFSLANGNDVPYNINLSPYAGMAAGSSASQSLGTELDLQATYDLNEEMQFRLGYSHFWAGNYYNTTPGVPSNLDANFLYSHFQVRF